MWSHMIFELIILWSVSQAPALFKEGTWEDYVTSPHGDQDFHQSLIIKPQA